MSLREISELKTILISGDPQAAGGLSTFTHGVSEGEYIFESACLTPFQNENAPTWVSLQFIPEYTDRRERNVWLGWGFAMSDRFPVIIKGPVPLTGNGYFLVEGECVSLNDRVEGTFSYRKVKHQ